MAVRPPRPLSEDVTAKSEDRASRVVLVLGLAGGVTGIALAAASHSTFGRVVGGALSVSAMALFGHACVRERRARQRLQRALEESAEERRKIIATVSHDFRSPLTAVVGFTQLLCDQEDSLDPQRRRDYLRVIREQSQQLGRMIEDTVDLSRAAEGRLKINPTDLRLEEVVESALTLLDHPADRDRITLAIAPDAPSVWADPYELEQVLDRLLHLALTRSAKGAEVIVQAAACDGVAQITVRADGLDTSAECFRPLHEDLDAAYAFGQQDHRGLFMAATRALVELHGGSISAEEGAILLTLPASCPEPVAEPALRDRSELFA